MYKISDIEYIYWGVMISILVLIIAYFLLSRRDNLIEAIGDRVKSHFSLMSNKGWWVKNILLALGVLLIFVGLSNPKWGNKKAEAVNSKADIFIAFDISQSMLAEDTKPSRIIRAQKWATDLVESLKGNRLGLIYFAGESYLQVPLTSDYAAVEFALKGASPNLAGAQGTNISATIQKTTESFVEGETHDRVLVIISDGEEHEQEAMEIAQKARENNLIIFTVGVGTTNGAPVPMIYRGRETYKKDSSGKYVQSKLNKGMLKELAANGGGSFYMVNQGKAAIEDIKSKIQKYQKLSKEKEVFNEKESYFQYFLGLGMLLLLLAWFLPIRKS